MRRAAAGGPCAHGAGARRPGRRLLPRPHPHARRRLWAERRLRPVREDDGASSRPAYSGPAEHRGAEHAGCRQPARDQLALFGRAARRLGDRHLRPRHAAARDPRHQPGRDVRSAQVQLARLGGPPLVLGGTAVGAAGSDVPIILRDTLGINVKLVEGYQDSGAIFLAVDRGEIGGRTVDLSSMKSFRPGWMTPNGGMRALVQFARATRHPDFPDVPTARELARNDAARALIELAELPYAMSRPFAAPPDLPPDRAKALQGAFLAMHDDPQYLEDAAKLRIDVSPIGGDGVLRAIDGIGAASPDLLEYVRKLLAETRGGG